MHRQLFACAALALGLGTSVPVAVAQTIKIGSFVSVTGPAFFLGDPEKKTLEMMVEKINKEGGVLGRKIELVLYDDGSNAATARTLASRLIDNDKVDILIGGSVTPTTMAAVPLAEKAGVPFVSLAGGTIISVPVKKWVFVTPQTSRMACAKVLEDMKKRGITTIAIMAANYGVGEDMRAECVALSKEYNVTIAAVESYGPKDSDMTAQLAKIRGIQGVQAVLNVDTGQGPAIVTRNYRQLGITVPLYQLHGVASQSYIDLSGGAADGVRLPAGAMIIVDQLPDEVPQKSIIRAYKEAYEAKYNSPVSTFGGHAHDGLLLVIDALKRAGSTDKEKVRAALEQTKDLVGTAGPITMSRDNHSGLGSMSMFMVEVRGGKWKLVQ
nr:ABC transporter substrate-binding protein [Nitrosomonas nitrosa]